MILFNKFFEVFLNHISYFVNFVAYSSQNGSLNTPLQEDDKEIYELIQKEKYRQYSGLELIASEVLFLIGNYFFFFRKLTFLCNE
jgi:hypothetical protein